MIARDEIKQPQDSIVSLTADKLMADDLLTDDLLTDWAVESIRALLATLYSIAAEPMRNDLNSLTRPAK